MSKVSPVILSPVSQCAYSGSSVNVVANVRQSLVSCGSTRFAAFYDADATMVLAKQVLGESHWELQRTDFKGNVADAHNSISLGVDGSGYLHVAWNNHVDSLNYARSVAPLSLNLAAPSLMTGKHERRVTYPQFHPLPDGDLLFLFRDGTSGKGNLALNRFFLATGEWRAIQASVIDGDGRCSPYWGMTVDIQGTLHLAWTWRDTTDVSTNHDIAYARSSDQGLTWGRSDGSTYDAITMDSAEYVMRIPTNSNLMNPPFIAADSGGRPLILTYWSSEDGAAPRFHVITPGGKEWKVVPVDHPLTPFRLVGKGTKRPPISRGIVLTERRGDGSRPVHVVYRDDSHGGGILVVSSRDIETAPWTTEVLHEGALGAWEPSYDPAVWEADGKLAMLVQKVHQVDGNDEVGEDAEPTPISMLTWTPSDRAVERQVTEASTLP